MDETFLVDSTVFVEELGGFSIVVVGVLIFLYESLIAEMVCNL